MLSTLKFHHVSPRDRVAHELEFLAVNLHSLKVIFWTYPVMLNLLSHHINNGLCNSKFNFTLCLSPFAFMWQRCDFLNITIVSVSSLPVLEFTLGHGKLTSNVLFILACILKSFLVSSHRQLELLMNELPILPPPNFISDSNTFFPMLYGMYSNLQLEMIREKIRSCVIDRALILKLDSQTECPNQGRLDSHCLCPLVR